MRPPSLLSIFALFLGAGVLIPVPVLGQTFTYAEECVSNVKNATVHVPSNAEPSLPGGAPVEPGDTLAVYTAEGTCAGYGVWTDQEGATLAAAGSDSIAVSADGYASGEPLRFEVFDVSEGSAIDIGSTATFASCENVGVPVCGEGDYENGTFHRVTGLQPDSIETVARTIPLAEGWNFVSLPVQSELSFGSLFPACSKGFSYVPGEGYTTVGEEETLPVGTGVAVHCEADSTSVTGTVGSSTIEVEAGWNLIGGVQDTVAVDAIDASPSDIVVSEFFRLPAGQGYTSAPALYPGEGYWVKTAEAGTLDVSGTKGTLAAGSATSNKDPADVAHLSFVDAEGQQMTLQLREGLTDEERAQFELPPIPPGEIFDVRFASGHEAASFSSSGATEATEHGVRIQGAVFPVKVRLETHGADRQFEIDAGDDRFTLSKEQPTAQIQESTGRLGVTPAPNPDEFRLAKASPNPLRGQTELEYALPKKSEVSIAVFDVLGRRVARLVDAERQTGVHQTRLDAGPLPSGKYFVRMRAGRFRQTRQLTVVR